VAIDPRPFDPASDQSAIAELLGYTRANGGVWHPGGIQWWLREVGRDGFASFVVDGHGGLEGFLLIDDKFVLAEHGAFGQELVDLFDWATDRLRETGRPSMTTNVAEGTDLERELKARGLERTGYGYELVADTPAAVIDAPLPDGFRFGSLLDMTPDEYIEMHRASWSDSRPSPYRRELHDRVLAAPQFRPELVTVAFAPDGRGAAYCIGWMDEQSQTLEIEPLGTHRDFRRLGLARAVVREVIRRAAESGARDVLVWNEPDNNLPAYGLYTSAGMTRRRTLVELQKEL
jgi:GNAT superfamily N-acetyltransferase